MLLATLSSGGHPRNAPICNLQVRFLTLFINRIGKRFHAEQFSKQLNPFNFRERMFLLPLRGQHQRNAEAINSFVIILTAARSKVHHQVRACRQDLLQRNRRPVPNLGGLALLHPHIQGAIRDILSLAHRRNAFHQSQAKQESDLRRRKRHHPLERHVQDSHLGMSRRKARGGRAIPFGPLAQ